MRHTPLRKARPSLDQEKAECRTSPSNQNEKKCFPAGDPEQVRGQRANAPLLRLPCDDEHPPLLVAHWASRVCLWQPGAFHEVHVRLVHVRTITVFSPPFFLYKTHTGPRASPSPSRTPIIQRLHCGGSHTHTHVVARKAKAARVLGRHPPDRPAMRPDRGKRKKGGRRWVGFEDGRWKKLCLNGHGLTCVLHKDHAIMALRCFTHSCVLPTWMCFLVSGSPSADHIVLHASGLEPAHGTRFHGVPYPQCFTPQGSSSTFWLLPPSSYEIMTVWHIPRFAYLPTPHGLRPRHAQRLEPVFMQC